MNIEIKLMLIFLPTFPDYAAGRIHEAAAITIENKFNRKNRRLQPAKPRMTYEPV
jgi:hypothetical protein